jgi:hypothetical protein
VIVFCKEEDGDEGETVIAKHRITFLLLAGLAIAVIVYFSLLYLPMSLLPLHQKPTPQPIYDYYEIVDEVGGESLMTIPLIVNVGDELLTEDNRRFQVVKVIENKAYARRVANTLQLPGKE